MNDRSGILTPSRVATASGTPRPRSRARLRAIGVVRDAFKDVVAGLVSSIVLIANIVSFGALMFPGELAHGVPIAICAMLIGSCIAGTWIALRTSLPPLVPRCVVTREAFDDLRQCRVVRRIRALQHAAFHPDDVALAKHRSRRRSGTEHIERKAGIPQHAYEQVVEIVSNASGQDA